MPKKSLKQQDEDVVEMEDYFQDYEDGFEEEDHMDSMFDVLKGSQRTALALTNLIVDKCDIKGLNEDKVFSIFNRASEEVMQTFANTMNAMAGPQEEEE